MLGRQAFPVKVRVIGIGENLGNDSAEFFLKMDHCNTGMGHIKARRHHRIRNIQQAAHNLHAHTFVSKKRNSLLIIPQLAITICLQIVAVAKGFQESIQFPLDASNAGSHTGFCKIRVGMPGSA